MKRSLLKRKQGLIKKAMELSIRCEQDVFITIFDHKTQQMLMYKSTPDFDMRAIKTFESGQNQHFRCDQFTNEDFDLFNEKMSAREIKLNFVERVPGKAYQVSEMSLDDDEPEDKEK